MGEAQSTRLFLIPTGQTCWDEEGRLIGNADLPLSPEGIEQVKRWAEPLREIGLDVLFSVPGGTGEETMNIIAGALRVRPRHDMELAEINLGLWQGMPLAEIKARHPRVYRQMIENPDSVTPPEGERLAEAQHRLDACIHRLIRKYQGQRIGIVLGPFALTLVRLSREGKKMSDFWTLMKEPRTWHEYRIVNGDKVNGENTEEF